MTAKNGSVKSYIIVLICIFVISLVAFTFFISMIPKETSEPPSRENSIPVGAIKMTPETDSHPPIIHSDEWNQPVPLSSVVNTAGGEDSPFILPDGSMLYFFFTPNVTVPAEKQLLDQVTGIYVFRMQNGVWATAERVILQEAGKLALDGAVFIRGDVMWFASAREGYTGVNLFTAVSSDGKWVGWQYVGDKLMKDYQVGEMHIGADGNTLFFHSDRAGGKGGLDIWVSQNVAGEWQMPQNVDVVNTADNEGWPFTSQDGTELWFTRTYLGSPAIYRSLKSNGVWQAPQLIISQFAGEPTLDNEGNLYFVHHFFNDVGEMVEADIYVAYKR